MKKLAVVLAVLFCMSLATGASANWLVNGGFETGDVTGWDISGRTQGGWGVTTDGAPEGIYAGQFVEGYFSGARADAFLTQTVAAAGFQGDLEVSGWVKRYVLGDGFGNLGPDAGNMTARVLVDGVEAWSQTWAADDTWHNFSAVIPGVNVVSDVAVQFQARLFNEGYKTFDIFQVDGVEVVPEPGSMMALGAGLMGLAGFVARRRR